MKKGRRPRRPKDPGRDKDARDEEDVARQTQEKAQLIPPSRRPPTAVGAATPPLPPQEPPRSRPAPLSERDRPALLRLVEALRNAVGAMLDIADATAEALRKRLEGRA